MLKKKIKKKLIQLRYKFDSKLPIGVTEFNEFCDSIIHTYDLPDFLSYRHSIATMIMHLGETATHKPKAWFAKCITNAMAKEVAFEMIQKLKKEMQEKFEAEKKALEEKKEPSVVPSETI